VGADLPYKKARSQMIEAFEREYVRGLLSNHDGNISQAARAAGIDRVYLHRLIKKYEL
jgi:transcriptional regulator of acetoin/glycerol metabolism